MVDPAKYTGPSEFVHLHNHSIYSVLDGVSLPSQYAEQCHKRGYPAMSATEHGHMASVPDMYHAFKQHGLKFIAACEVYYNDYELARQRMFSGDTQSQIENTEEGVENSKTMRELRNKDPETYQRMARNRHLTLLAKNEIGFSNLIKLTTQAFNTGLFGLGKTKYPRIWFDKLCEFKEGLIVLSGCLNGPVSHELRLKEIRNYAGEIVREVPETERITRAVKYVKKFKQAFGEDYYMELQMPGIPDDDEVFLRSIEIAETFGIDIVLTNDAHYLERRDFELQKIMMAVSQGVTVNDKNLFHTNSSEQFMKTRAELWATFRNNGYSKIVKNNKLFETMCDNTLKIADRCQHLKIDSDPKIPVIANADDELCSLVAKRLKSLRLDREKRKFLIDGKEVTYVEQAKIELNRFIEKGFASYFLITRDLVQHGRKRGLPFSPRGSAGGSLVCFLLDIHTLNPMLWELSFDRFMSPSRGGYLLDTKMVE